MALDPKYKAVVFDMDGTFMDTKVDYVKLANVVFDEMVSQGVPECIIDRSNGSRSEFQSGVKWIRDNGRSKELPYINRMISDRITSVELENASLARPFDGSMEILERLEDKGYKKGILTRGGHQYAERILNLHGILNRFDTVIARDDYPEEESKPSPLAMKHVADAIGVRTVEILYLGDHAYDWMTARDSGAGFYGVLSGGFSMDDWKTTDKNISVLNSVKDLLKII